jgi:hypothetical protein
MSLLLVFGGATPHILAPKTLKISAKKPIKTNEN